MTDGPIQVAWYAFWLALVVASIWASWLHYRAWAEARKSFAEFEQQIASIQINVQRIAGRTRSPRIPIYIDVSLRLPRLIGGSDMGRRLVTESASVHVNNQRCRLLVDCSDVRSAPDDGIWGLVDQAYQIYGEVEWLNAGPQLMEQIANAAEAEGITMGRES